MGKQIFITILILVDVGMLMFFFLFFTSEWLCLSFRLLEMRDLDKLQCMSYCSLSVCMPRFSGLILLILIIIYSCTLHSVGCSITMLKIWIPSHHPLYCICYGEEFPLLYFLKWWRGFEPLTNLQIKTLK